MKFENTEVWGFKGAILGMRNPMKSRDKSDSVFEIQKLGMMPLIGNADLKLAHSLLMAGTEHSKFMRFIHVQADMTATRMIWSECDTYKFFEKNSESTMHKLLNKDSLITIDMFDYDEDDAEVIWKIIDKLNYIRDRYLNETDGRKKNRLLYRAKCLLPEGFKQMRTIDTNYAELRNMYKQRHNHRLKEWNTDFKEWVESLPYSAEFITYGLKGEQDD